MWDNDVLPLFNCKAGKFTQILKFADQLPRPRLKIMKIQHKGCGGEVLSVVTQPYKSEEHGEVPKLECLKCHQEILGDAQIEFVPDNEIDKATIESLRK